jgi:hypothetical protein
LSVLIVRKHFERGPSPSCEPRSAMQKDEAPVGKLRLRNWASGENRKLGADVFSGRQAPLRRLILLHRPEATGAWRLVCPWGRSFDFRARWIAPRCSARSHAHMYEASTADGDAPPPTNHRVSMDVKRTTAAEELHHALPKLTSVYYCVWSETTKLFVRSQTQHTRRLEH